MDFETPVDAWYVWLGVATASIVLAGVAFGLPSQPPPDAPGTANAIDSVAGSTQTATATYEHGAEAIRFDSGRVSLRRDGKTAHATIAFGPVIPLAAVSNSTHRAALTQIVTGQDPETVLTEPAFGELEEAQLRRAVERTRRNRLDDRSEWYPATGRLRVRQVTLDGRSVVLVSVTRLG